MGSIWTSEAAATSFRLAARSPLVRAHTRTLARFAGRRPDDLAAWQRARAHRATRFARQWTTHYRTWGRSDDIESRPLTTKSDVITGFDALRVRGVPARIVTTGGTEGRPAAIAVSHASFFTEWAHIAYTWAEAGISLTSPKLALRGSNLGEGFDATPFRFQATYNQFAVSPFHLSTSTFECLRLSMEDFRPRAIWGYPSAITPFAQWAMDRGPLPELSQIRAVLLASEAAFDWQVALFEEAFGATVVRWYGQSEKVAFASHCRSTGMYHIHPTYGLVELVGDRIVGTGFTNRAMPLLRYDTEDRSPSLSSGCACGSPFPTLGGVQGRWDQAILWGADGEPISTTALNFHDPVFMRFERFQFRQSDRGKVDLLVVASPTDGSAEQRLREAHHALQHRVGDRLEITVVPVGAADLLSRRGKVVVVDQRYRPDRPGGA